METINAPEGWYELQEADHWPECPQHPDNLPPDLEGDEGEPVTECNCKEQEHQAADDHAEELIDRSHGL